MHSCGIPDIIPRSFSEYCLDFIKGFHRKFLKMFFEEFFQPFFLENWYKDFQKKFSKDSFEIFSCGFLWTSSQDFIENFSIISNFSVILWPFFQKFFGKFLQKIHPKCLELLFGVYFSGIFGKILIQGFFFAVISGEFNKLIIGVIF